MLNLIRGGQALALLSAFVLCSFTAQAQSSTTQKRGHQAEGKQVTVTGCLQKGDEPDEFSITGANGRTYGLRSTAVNLGEHVGHKVTVKGTVSRDEKEEKEAQEKNEGKKEYADLKVADLKMVSQSCQ